VFEGATGQNRILTETCNGTVCSFAPSVDNYWSLGLSGFKWSDVESVLGHFTGQLNALDLQLGNGVIFPTSDSATAVQIKNSTLANSIVVVDTTNNRIGINKTPSVALDVNGAIQASIPLAVASGGTGDTGTAWTTFTPSPSCGTATFTVNSAKSKTLGKTTFIEGDFTITAIGSCTQPVNFTLPNTPNSTGILAGAESSTGKGMYCLVLGASTTAACSKADVSVFGVNNVLRFSGVYENQ